MSTYWMVMAGSALACFGLMAARGKRYQLAGSTAPLFFILAVPMALLAGRGMYFLCSLDWIIDRGVSFLQFDEGHFMLYGTLLGGAAAACAAGRMTGRPAASVLDAAACSAALMIAAERFSEYLIGMGYGVGIEEWFDPWGEWSMIAWENPEFLCRFPFGMQNYYGTWRFAVNLPEGLWALTIAGILLKSRPRKKGGETVMMLLLYAAGQILLETLRRDEVMKWSFVQVNQLLSALILAGILLLCWRMQPAPERHRKKLLISLGLMLLLAGIVMLMEFALDQKIAFLFWMKADLSYLTDLACCAGMAFLVLPIWRKAFPIISPEGRGPI